MAKRSAKLALLAIAAVAAIAAVYLVFAYPAGTLAFPFSTGPHAQQACGAADANETSATCQGTVPTSTFSAGASAYNASKSQDAPLQAAIDYIVGLIKAVLPSPQRR